MRKAEMLTAVLTWYMVKQMERCPNQSVIMAKFAYKPWTQMDGLTDFALACCKNLNE